MTPEAHARSCIDAHLQQAGEPASVLPKRIRKLAATTSSARKADGNHHRPFKVRS
jgi:hypothetical protein